MVPSNGLQTKGADVLNAIIEQGGPGFEKNPAQESESNKNIQTAKEESAGNGKKPEEQKQVAQPKTFKVGKKVETPKKEEGVDNGKEAAAQREAAEREQKQFEERFNSTVSEKFKVDPKTLSEIVSEYPNLKKQLEADPYRDPFTRSMDELIAKGHTPESAYKYLRADVTKMSPKELKAFDLQQQYPEMDIEKINRQIDRTYKLGEYAPKKKDAEGNEVPDERDGLEQLEFDTLPIKKNFDEVRGKMLEQTTSRAKVIEGQKEAQRIAQWQPQVEQILSDFTSDEVLAPNGNKFQFDVELDEPTRKLYTKELALLVKNNPNITPEGVKATLKNYYRAQNFEKMAIAFAEQARSMSDLEWMDAVHNPSLGNTNGNKVKDFDKKEVGTDEAIINMISAAQKAGGNRKRP